MKVNIKKEGKTKNYKLISKWEEVTMDKWLKLIELETGSKTKEAEETIVTLSNIPRQLVKELSVKDVAMIMEKLAEVQKEASSSLKKIVEVEGQEYGFIPDLNEITLGEYADIETFIKNGLEKHLPEIMAVLFRPILEKEDAVYSIKAYDGNIRIRAERFKKMSAEQVQSALVFFWTFGKELPKILPLYLMQSLKGMTKQQQLKVLQISGVGLG